MSVCCVATLRAREVARLLPPFPPLSLSSPLRHGVNYEMCLPLQGTETGHITLVIKKDLNATEGGTRFDKMLVQAKNMESALEAMRMSRHALMEHREKKEAASKDAERIQAMRRMSTTFTSRLTRKQLGVFAKEGRIDDGGDEGAPSGSVAIAVAPA